jgi:hypothetical protein
MEIRLVNIGTPVLAGGEVRPEVLVATMRA